MTPVKEITRGRWRYLLPGFGIEATFLTGRHGPCPLCQGGKDRFRFDDKDGDGTWFCNSCGAGDGVKLVMLKTGLDFKEAVKEIEKRVQGAPPPSKQRPTRTDDDRRRAMNALWSEAQPIRCGDVVWRYLTGRGMPDPLCITDLRDLRHAPAARYYPNPKDRSSSILLPAMLAKVRDADGRPVNIHRTFLASDGSGKAKVDEPRKMMDGRLPRGAAVRLGEAAMEMGVAEGIETAMAATVLYGIPVWPLLTADNLAAWSPPEGVGALWVFGDNDLTFTGQAAAYALAKRLTLAKRPMCAVHIPAGLGQDWNDVLRERKGAQVA